MANRLFSPDEQYCDEDGLPYAGGFLYFYASGTDTPLNTYSNRALSVANTNPVVLDSAGRAGAIFLQNLAYKVILKDSDANTIWTEDPVYSSDFSTDAQFLTYAGNPNGNVAGTAGSGTVDSSVIWDRTNNILYVCTTTGTSSTAVWTAVNPAASASAAVPLPGGYLTLTSATPIITGDVTAATAVYYTPFRGNQCPIYGGSSFSIFTFTEQTLTLVSAHAASTIYDIFAFSNSGVFTIGTGPAWTNSGAGTGARGSGAATTQLTLLNGIWVNAVSMTARNGNTTYTVDANQGTYLGSIFVDGSAGQVSCYRTWGSSRKWGVWNYYNRQPTYLLAGDSTATWNYNNATIRQSNGATTNSLTIFCGIAELATPISFSQRITMNTNAANAQPIYIGVGVNSTTAFSGQVGSLDLFNGSGTVLITTVVARANYILAPSLGINTINMLEQGTATGTHTFQGTQSYMELTAQWLA